jgi:hypothetical protein
MKEIQISSGGANVTVRVLGYERPSSSDECDANWLKCIVDIDVFPFRGSYEASFATQDFLRLEREISAMHSKLCGEAIFDPEEGALDIRFKINSLGQVLIEGKAVVLGETRANLKFSFSTDQSYLGKLRQELASAVEEFPVK